MSRQKNPNSRWLKGAVRYTAADRALIDKHFGPEPFGWFRGARVRRR